MFDFFHAGNTSPSTPGTPHRSGSRPRPGVLHDGLMLDHLSIQCADLAASAAFYDAALAPLGGQRIFDFDDSIGYGVPPDAELWIGLQRTGDGFRESHIAVTAPDRAAVRAFF